MIMMMKILTMVGLVGYLNRTYITSLRDMTIYDDEDYDNGWLGWILNLNLD